MFHATTIPWALLFGVVVWKLWNDRNGEVIGGDVRDKWLSRKSIGVATNHIRANHIIQNLNGKCNPSYINHNITSGRICISVDGAVCLHRAISAVGVIAKDPSGFALYCRNWRMGLTSPLFAELYAILAGLELIVEENWNGVVIESDSKLAVDICKH